MEISKISCNCLLLVVCILISLFCGSSNASRRNNFFDDSEAIHTEIVGNNRTILAMFNLTEEQMERISARPTPNYEHSTPARGYGYFNNIKRTRENDIRDRISSAIQQNTAEDTQQPPFHEVAFYPLCNGNNDESSWMQGNNVTIRFSEGLFEPKNESLNLDSAILRLFKINPNHTDSQGSELPHPEKCGDPLLDTQIRVTVSIVQHTRRNKRERKKRICNTLMMNVSKTGWVEIDIKRAIYIWESVERQQQLQQQQQHNRQPILVGLLMIEVHDDEDRPLKPGMFFKPPNCGEQAGVPIPIPWNYYRPHSTLSSLTTNDVPRYPRIDVKLVGYASFAPKNHNKASHQRFYENLRRQMYRLSSSSAEKPSLESSTVITPTSNNYLEVSSEEVHKHHKRHSQHRHRQANHHHHP